jgi:hypothetical protein
MESLVSGSAEEEAMDSLPPTQRDPDRPSGLPHSSGTAQGQYIRIALELFAACMTTREAHHIPNDTPVIGAIVSMIQCAVPTIKTILLTNFDARIKTGTVHTATDADSKTVGGIDEKEAAVKAKREDLRLLWPVAKAFACLEMCFDQAGYHTAFRECEGLGPLMSILELYGTYAHLIPFFTRGAIKSVIEDALSLLGRNIETVRRGVLSAADSGIQALYQQSFSKICGFVFQTTYKQNDYLWLQVLTLIKAAINTEPAFLSHFLRSSHASLLSAILKKVGDRTQLLFHNDMIVMSIARLAASMCITADGQAYVLSNRMVPFILEAVVHPSLLMPACEGVSIDTLTRCGRIIAQIARESEPLRQIVKDTLQNTLLTICAEAKRIWKDIDIRDEPTLNSPRMQELQKLGNICLIIENMSVDSRRLANDLLREILSEEVIEAIVRAYPCTLPPSRQLFCQLSLRHTGAFHYYGYHAVAKALTSLLKVAVGIVPQLLLPVLFRAIDESLGLISASKQALRALATPSTLSANASVFTPAAKSGGGGVAGKIPSSYYDSNSMGFGLGYESSDFLMMNRRNRSRSRGSSFGQPGANVLTLGVLDCIPHKCIFDADFVENELNLSPELEKHTWNFMSSLLQLEWLTSMASNGLRPMQRTQGPSLVTAGKDVFRRLFAFQRSSMLEVCRFSVSKWSSKVRKKSMVLLIHFKMAKKCPSFGPAS